MTNNSTIEKPVRGFFVTGTGTGVGKTFVAATLARTLVDKGYRVGVYKPALSGCESELSSNATPPLDSAADDVRLWQAASCPGRLCDVSPQRFRAPLAPHLAARVEGKEIDTRLLRTGLRPWQAIADLILVESAGGLFSPLSDNELNADLALEFGFPVVLVAPNSLGVIHATLATLFAAQNYRSGLRLAAVVMNDVPGTETDPSRELNFQELARRCSPCPVVRLAMNEERSPALLQLLARDY